MFLHVGGMQSSRQLPKKIKHQVVYMLLFAFVIPCEQNRIIHSMLKKKNCLVTHLVAHINNGKAFYILSQKLYRDGF